MKILNSVTIVAVLAFTAVSSLAQDFGDMGFGERDSRTVLVLKPDGSSVLTNQSTQSRRMLEMQVFSWEQMSKMEESDTPDEDAANPATAPGQPPRKPLTDQELTAKVREMYQKRPDAEDEELGKVESVEVSSNSVRLVTTRSFTSLKELLSQSPYLSGPNTLRFDNIRAELDTNHNFRLTFTANERTARFSKNAARQWKSAKIKSEWKLILPGKIVSSGLPNTQDTATWLTLDADKPETLEAAAKLIGAPLIITAEPAGLKLDEPLECNQLMRASAGRNKSEPDLPITDAAGGFLAEPISITLATVHYFPGGEKFFQGRMLPSMMGFGPTGAVVAAKLFPPKGRELRSVTNVRVRSAKDDKGRSIAVNTGSEEGQENYREYTTYGGEESGKGATRIELRIGLPAADAKAIDTLDAEAVALTLGGWKEMVITNVQADTNKPIDLGEVLLGAKITIKKISGHKPERRVEATLEGPKEISQLDVKIKLPTRRGGQSNLNERRSTQSAGKSVRNITIESYEFEPGNEANLGPLSLLVRYPQDLKRERVQFKLTALDLL